MSSSNWIRIVIAICIGVIAGLVYGWTIDPIEYTNVTPGILRADYRADYVLMVAEAYQTEQDSDAAARRLAILSSEPPPEIVSSTLEYGRKNDFTESEITLLQGLLSSMQTFQPAETNPP